MGCQLFKKLGLRGDSKAFYFYFRELRKEVSERETSFLMQCEISVFSVVLFSAKRFKDFGQFLQILLCGRLFGNYSHCLKCTFLLQFLSIWCIVFIKYILLIYKTYNYGNEQKIRIAYRNC